MEMTEEIDRHLSEKHMVRLFAISTHSDKILSETGGLTIVENNMVPAVNTKLIKLFRDSLQFQLELSNNLFINSIEVVSFQDESEGEGKVTTVVALLNSIAPELSNYYLDEVFSAVNVVSNPDLILTVAVTGETGIGRKPGTTDSYEVLQTGMSVNQLTLTARNFARDLCYACASLKNKRPSFSIYFPDRRKPVHYKGDIAKIEHGPAADDRYHILTGQVDGLCYRKMKFDFLHLTSVSENRALEVCFQTKANFLSTIRKVWDPEGYAVVKLIEKKGTYFEPKTFQLEFIREAEDKEVHDYLQGQVNPDLLSL